MDPRGNTAAWVVLQPSAAGDGEPPLPDRSLAGHLRFAVAAVDKAAGPTSHDVVTSARRLLGVSKAGHGGTLDPAVTGVLPVFFGGATRLSALSLAGGKAYRAVARFHADIGEEELRALLARFSGAIAQTPPRRSRVVRRERTRTVHEGRLLSLTGRDALLHFEVEAGTYIRKLIHDMGAARGSGAHMAWLRRTRAGAFGEDRAVTLEALADALAEARDGDETALRAAVRPAEILASTVPRMVVDPGAARAVARGAVLAAAGVLRFEPGFAAGDVLALLGEDGSWVALAEALQAGEGIAGRGAGLVARTRRVLVDVEAPGL